MTANPVNWWEIGSTDGDVTAKFLATVFDWQLNYDATSGIWRFPLKDVDRSRFAGGGIFTIKDGKEPHVTIYVEVDDVDDTAAKIEPAGGTIHEPPMVVPGIGCKICLFKDPTGLIIAMIEKPNSD